MKVGEVKKKVSMKRIIENIWFVFVMVGGFEIKEFYHVNFWIYIVVVIVVLNLGNYLINKFYGVRKMS